MNKFLILFFFMFVAPYSFAEGLDYGADFGFRSKPIGAAISGVAGYSKILWGTNDETAEKKSIMYGYVRPNARVTTSVVVNKLGAGIDFFPISILGVTASYVATHRGYDSKRIYQNLINLYLRECAMEGKKPSIKWQKTGTD